MKSVKLHCTYEEMRAIIRALNNYKYDLQDESDKIPSKWFDTDDADKVNSIMHRIYWEDSEVEQFYESEDK